MDVVRSRQHRHLIFIEPPVNKQQHPARRSHTFVAGTTSTSTTTASSMSSQTPIYKVQETPLQPHTSSRQPTQTIRGPYGPSCIREWVVQQEPNPSRQDIAKERHKRQYNIHRDGQEFPAQAGNNFLHPHFCHNSQDRQLAFVEGVGDIKDAVCSCL